MLDLVLVAHRYGHGKSASWVVFPVNTTPLVNDIPNWRNNGFLHHREAVRVFAVTPGFIMRFSSTISIFHRSFNRPFVTPFWGVLNHIN
jgi:hypothetical protein